MSVNDQQTLEDVCRWAQQTALLSAAEELLSWDERCMLPPAGGEFRAEQLTLLAGIVHERNTDRRYGEQLAELANSPLAADDDTGAATIIRELRRDFELSSKLPKSLVEELARTTTLGQQAWDEARRDNDFPRFAPWLEKIFHLKRQEATALGYVESPYDALLDQYEPGERASQVAVVLSELRSELAPLVKSIVDSGRLAPCGVLAHHYPTDAQSSFGMAAAARMGFDFNRGRLDVTSHPMCMSPGPDDCRITTRYDERFFNSGFFSILHEAGHGMYEQGLPSDSFGLPTGSAVSLGVHESQSRLWENLVGRSEAYWDHQYSHAQLSFPSALAEVSRDTFYFAVNDARPSLIRVEADEATYNLHIIIRFELEQELLADQLKIADLPEAWNARYSEYLGIEPQRDAEGVLQDIHWSAGLVGYFPTYSLGNLYACQFYEQANQDIGPLDEHFRKGDFAPLLAWLRDRIHRHGKRRRASELVRDVTGQSLSHAPLMRHLRSKYERLYGL